MTTWLYWIILILGLASVGKGLQWMAQPERAIGVTGFLVLAAGIFLIWAAGLNIL
jgi:vacuolar-type H+-ATPase subunit I/STV1